LRDIRSANGRDPETGDGDGNDSWIGLSIAMIVLDTLSSDGDTDKVLQRSGGRHCHRRHRPRAAFDHEASV